MDVVVVVVEDVVAISMAVDEVDGLLAVVPRRLRELHSTGGRECGNLVLHIGHAVVDEHGPHGETRPIDAVGVDVVAGSHLVDGLEDEVLVFGASDVPSAAIAT